MAVIFFPLFGRFIKSVLAVLALSGICTPLMAQWDSGIGDTREQPTLHNSRAKQRFQVETRLMEQRVRELFQSGQFEAAAYQATELLELVGYYHDDTGDAFHLAHVILGHCALQQGNVSEAKKHLSAAGSVRASSALAGNGPDMSLAKALLREGEVEVVLRYFEQCRSLWGRHGGRLNEWSATVRKGLIPRFGSNETSYVVAPTWVADNTIAHIYREEPHRNDMGRRRRNPPMASYEGRNHERQQPSDSVGVHSVETGAMEISLAPRWDGPITGGTGTMRDLFMLFSQRVAASPETKVARSFPIYRSVDYLMPATEAMKALGITRRSITTTELACPGFPLGSFRFYTFDGFFEGFYNKLYLLVDRADRVVSVQLVSENPRRNPDSRSGGGERRWHTYNFINSRTKALDSLEISHRVTQTNHQVLQLDSELWQPDSRGYSVNWRNVEAVRWYAPKPLLALVMYCIQKSGSR